MGKVIAVCISEKKGTQKHAVPSAKFLPDWGIENDAHAGKWHRQVSLLSHDKVEAFRARGAKVASGAFGENLVVEGIDFAALPIGTRFQCNDVLLELTQIGKECHSHCEIFKKMGECIMPTQGVFTRVLKGGEIAEDVTSYYATSEQIPTVCALGVLVNPDLTVRAAGGFLLQLLPFCPEDVITRLERNVAALEPMTAMLDKGMTPEEILRKALAGFDFDVLDTREPAYRCTCSRERVLRAFAALSPEQLRSLPDEQGRTEAVCHFCDAVYRFTPAELEALAEQSEKGSSC